LRNRRYQEAGITDRERPLLLLVSRWVLEQLSALSDATEGRIDRHALCASWIDSSPARRSADA
jgi:hypothetical protein